MENKEIIDLNTVADTTDPYKNVWVALANDHLVSLSIMTQPYFWHYHPNSDEVFIVLEGILIIDLKDRSIELGPNQLFKISINTPHRTRPKNERTINLTISKSSIETIDITEMNI